MNTATQQDTQAAANKAAEEGGLPALPAPATESWPSWANQELLANERARLAGELCIGISNNDQGVRVSIIQRHSDGTATVVHEAKAPAGDSFARFAIATPPATTGASTAPRPTDDELWDATLRDRDAYQEWADKLADAIAKHFGVDIGEHSNQNLPWAEALEAIENAEPVGASTVLTDAQIMQAWASVDTGGNGPELVSFGRAVERLVVAAQAGQVAVPEEALRVVRRLLDGSQPKDLTGAIMVIDSALNGGAAWTYDIDPPAGFTDYVQANYSGEVIFHDPAWHARRLWNAAMRNAKPPFVSAPSPAKESK